VRFLSDQHLAAATAAFHADAELLQAANGVSLRILYAVSDSAEGDFTYNIRISDGVVEMARGQIDEPDAVVRSSYETAASLNRGELANQTAIMMGKIKIKGSLMTLLRHQALLNRVQALASALPVTY